MNTIEQVANLRRENVSHMDIASALGISTSAVARAVKKARKEGLLEPMKPGASRVKITSELSGYGVLRGTINNALEAMTPEVRVWLMASTPDGTTVAGMLAAIATDAYHEEIGE